MLAQYDSMCFVLNVWPPDQFAPRPCSSVHPRQAWRTAANWKPLKWLFI